jgi:hypothetical protein
MRKKSTSKIINLYLDQMATITQTSASKRYVAVLAPPSAEADKKKSMEDIVIGRCEVVMLKPKGPTH